MPKSMPFFARALSTKRCDLFFDKFLIPQPPHHKK